MSGFSVGNSFLPQPAIIGDTINISNNKIRHLFISISPSQQLSKEYIVIHIIISQAGTQQDHPHEVIQTTPQNCHVESNSSPPVARHIAFEKSFLYNRDMHGLNVSEFTVLVGLGSIAAGFLGSLTGLGGGVVIVPLLSLVFGVDIRYAAGASLISVIATSSGAASAYVKEGYTNMRIGMFLEIATTIGALTGAFLAAMIATEAIGIIFGVILLFSAWFSIRLRPKEKQNKKADWLAERLKLNSTYPTAQGLESYTVRAVPAGFALMFVAGAISGLLGIGAGAFKVLALDQIMRLPFKVSTTTSNFMIGVTAAASAGVYLNKGYIDPGLAMPVMLGVLAGSFIGAKVLLQAKTRILRMVFSGVIVILAIEMIYQSLMGRI
jgi:uncharacterized membrane protein YfcA